MKKALTTLVMAVTIVVAFGMVGAFFGRLIDRLERRLERRLDQNFATLHVTNVFIYPTNNAVSSTNAAPKPQPPPAPVTYSSVKLGWEASPSAVGYRLFYGDQPRGYTNSVDVGAVTNWTMRAVSGATYYISVVGYNENGLQSDYSTEVVWHAPAQ